MSLRLAIGGILLLLAFARGASAQSLLSPNNGGLAFAGPTETHVLAIWYNPAALVDPTLEDNKIVVYLGGNFLFRQAEVSRFPIDPSTGQPPAGAQLGPADQWTSKQPDGFLGFYLRVSEKVVFGLAGHTPLRDYGGTSGRDTASPEDDSPLRYHRLHTWWYDFWVHPAASIRVGKNFSLGFGLPFIYSDFRELSFDRDGAVDCPPPTVDAGRETPYCMGQPRGYERLENTQRLRLNGSNWNLAVQAGFLARIKNRVHLGFSWISQQFWFDRSDVRLDGDGERPNATLSRLGMPDVPGFALIRYATPHVFHLGLRWLVSEKAEAILNFRVTSPWSLSGDQQGRKGLELRLSSDGFRNAGLPERVMRYRGLRWAARSEARGNYKLTDNVRLGGGAGFDLSPVPKDNTSADTMDGNTAFASLRAEWKPAKGFFFMGGYELGFMFPREVTPGAFDPQTGSRCAQAGRDLDDPDCADTFEGRAYSTAAGRYTQLLHTFSFGVGFDWTW